MGSIESAPHAVTTPGVLVDAPQLQSIAARQLIASPTNPRKSFDQAALEELAASIRANGLISPIVVRQCGTFEDFDSGETNTTLAADDPIYEVVAGERRLRACRDILEWEAIPCLVRTLTDAQVLEIQIVENLQRTDVHAMDEAQGYKRLLEIDLMKVDDEEYEEFKTDKKPRIAVIAQKVGKSVSYIYQRLKLADLVDEVAEAFRAGKLTASHAVDCARLQPEDQRRYLGEALMSNAGESYARERDQAASVRDMREWINEEVRRDLAKAPFSVSDVDLFPTAGACTNCPKMSAANPELLADLVQDDNNEQSNGRGKKKGRGTKPQAVCLDPECYREKVHAFVQIQADEFGCECGEEPTAVWGGDYWKKPCQGPDSKLWASDYYREVQRNDCEYAVPAIVVAGEGIGRKLWICIAKHCKTHHAGSGRSTGNAEERARREKRDIEMSARRQVLQQLEPKLTGQMPRADLELIVLSFFQHLGHDTQVAFGRALGWEPMKGKRTHGTATWEGAAEHNIPELSDAKLRKMLMFCAIAPDLHIPTWTSNVKDAPRLGPLADRYGVDVDAIRSELQAAAKAKKDAKKAQTRWPEKGAKR